MPHTISRDGPRHLRPLPAGRWLGGTGYAPPPAPPRRPRATAAWPAGADAAALGLGCAHDGPRCPVWRRRHEAAP